MPPGSSGLILGETLGRRAGETCDEVILALLLWPRGASCGVFLRFGVVAEEPGVSLGLWLVAAATPDFADTGDGSGSNVDGPPWADPRAGDRA
jgi:hypothetical protein